MASVNEERIKTLQEKLLSSRVNLASEKEIKETDRIKQLQEKLATNRVPTRHANDSITVSIVENNTEKNDSEPKTNAERLQALFDKSKGAASQGESTVSGGGSVVAGSNTTAYGRMGQVGKNSPAYAALYGIDRMETAPAVNELKSTLNNIEEQIAGYEAEKREAEKARSKAIQDAVYPIRQQINALDTYYTRGQGQLEKESYEARKASLETQEDEAIQAAKAEWDEKISDINGKISSAETQKTAAYASVMDAEDFGERSKFVTTKYGEPKYNTAGQYYSDTGYGDIEYDYINADEATQNTIHDIIGVNQRDQGIFKWINDNTYLAEMTEDEKAIYNYLHSISREDANAFLEYIASGLTARQRKKAEEKATAYAEEHPVLASVESLGHTVITKPVATVGQAMDYLIDGEIDQNAAYNRGVYIPSTYRETVGNVVEEKWGPIGSFAYNTGMSMGDFLMSTAVSGGNSAMSLMLMGTGSMADTVLSARDRGLSSDQAMALGVVAAGAEILTEKLSLDALFDLAGMGKSGVKYVLKNIFTEGSEEVTSEYINTMADMIVAGDQSEWSNSIKYYMSEEGGGLSEAEAVNRAMLDMAKNYGFAFLGGAVSGGVMGGGAVAVNSAVNAASNKAESKAAETKDEITVALDEVLGASEATQTTKAANFVDKISKTVPKKTNAVNASVDYIRAKIKNIDAEITSLDDADVSDPKEADEIKERKSALVTERASLVTADEVIRTKQKEIEELRRRKEKAEYAEVGNIDDDEDADGESAESGYNPIEDEDVRKAYESAAVSPETAAKELSQSYNGNLKETINLLAKEAANINASDLSSKVKREMLARLKSVDVALRKNNEAYVGEAVAQAKKKLAQYGVKNVYVDPGLSGMNNVKTNGYYDPKTKTVHLSPYLDDAALIWGTSIHEFVHFNAQHDMTLVNDGIKILESAIRDDPELAKRFNRSNYKAAYAENVSYYLAGAEGQAAVRSYIKDGLSPEEAAGKVADDYINEEMFAHYMQSLTEMNENDLLEVVRENRSLFRRILDAIMDFIEMLKGKSVETIKYEKAAKYLRTLLEYGTDVKTEAGEIRTEDGGGGIRHSFVGVNANSSDISLLDRAKEMERSGDSSEAIRQRTGWFKSYDGEWRFEVDDSSMEVRVDGNTPNYTTLGEIVHHPKLFRAYPELQRVDVVFQNLEGKNGSYSAQFDAIDLDRSLRNDPVRLKKTLLHEIQHAIQHEEGFTHGASPEYWNRRMEHGYDSRTKADREEYRRLEEEYDTIRREQPDFFDDMINLHELSPVVPRGEVDWNTLEQLEEDPPEWQRYDAEREAMEEKYGDTAVFDFINLIYHLEQARAKSGRGSVDLYYDTAGEIEARDTANRAEFDAEQRKNTRPDIDKRDVVFAGDSAVAENLVGWTVDGNEVYQTTQDTMKLSVSDRIAKFKKDFISDFQGRTAKFERNGHTYYAQFADLGKLTYEGKSRSSDSGYKAKIRMLADGNVFELVEDSYYKKTEPESGKKTAAHKDAMFWDYYIKTVVVDGKAYDVVINIREDVPSNNYSKKEHYVYSVMFQDNKKAATSVSSPATSKVLSQIDVTANNSIADDSGFVKSSGEKNIRFSKDVDAITAKEIEAVESHFGITSNFDVAGYLMTDGKMLDFSGRHWGDDSSTTRTVDHRDVLEAFDYEGVHSENNGIKAMVDMIGSGNIRLAPENGGINLAVKPNEEQVKVLREYIRHFNGEVVVDMDAVGGDTIHTFTYNKGTAPSTVVRDIMGYFEEGTVPKEQPEYRQFRYSKDVDASDFTYQSLVSKPDMIVPYLPTPKTFSAGNVTRSDIKAEAIRNARSKNNPKNTANNVYVRNKDTETDILVGSNGLNHGLNRSYEKAAVATSNIGELIENAVLINKHNARIGNEDGSVYLSVGHDGTDLYVCRIITNNNHALMDVEVLSALNAKKESAAHYRLGSVVNLLPYTDSTISIADLLDLVKTYFADVLPNDVLTTMNLSRPSSTVSGSMKYSRDVRDTRTTEDKLREENAYLKRQFVGKIGSIGTEWTKAVNEEVLGNVGRAVAKNLPNVASFEVISELKEMDEILHRDITEDYTEEQRYSDAREAAMKAARNLINKARLISVSDEWLDIRDLKKKLRETKVYVSDDVKSEFPEWQSVRRELSGALSITTTDSGALGVDAFYAELAGEYPEYFSPDITVPQQQMERIVEVARELKEIKKYQYESLWVNEADTMDASVAEAENNAAVEAFANGMLGEYANAAGNEVLKRVKKRGVKVSEASWTTRMLYQNIAKEMTRDAKAADYEAYRILRKINHGKEVEDVVKARKKNLRLLNRLYGYMTKPTNKNHVPEEMQSSVAKLLELFSGQKIAPGKTIDREGLRRASASSVRPNSNDIGRELDSLVEAVEANESNGEFPVSKDFVEEMASKVKEAKELFEETIKVKNAKNFAEVGENYYVQSEIEFLHEINDILSMVQKHIDSANKVFIDGKTESAKKFASELESELRKRPVKNELPGGKHSGKSSKPNRITLEHMTADTYFHLFGSVGDRIIKSFRKAQNVQVSRESVYAEFVRKNFEEAGGYDTHHTGWGGEPVTITVDGKSFDVTKGQLMQLYVTWMRPAGRRHITSGGVYFASRKGEQLSSRHVVFTEDSFLQVMGKLPPEDKMMAEKIASYLSTRCAEWGNAASMDLYGYEKFLDANYFPLLTASSETKKNWNKTEDYSTLENLGMTKSLKEGAKNAVVMVDFFDVADKHVRDMAAYSVYAPLNNDLTRVFDIGGVQQTVLDTLGKAAWDYFVDFQEDVNRNLRQGSENASSALWSNALTSMNKRQAVSFNKSTVVKQFLSYIRAMNSIESKYLHTAFCDKSMLPGGKTYQRILNDMTEYSGVAKMKMLGYSDIGFGKSLRSVYDDSYSERGDKFRNGFVRGAVKTYEGITEAGMWLAGKADEATWVRLWKACELEVDAKQSDLNGYERMHAVAERFNQVIGETQVVDTILDKAPVMKSRNGFVQQAYAFMNEPIKTMNTIYRAYEDVRLGKKGGGFALTKALGVFFVTNFVLEPFISALFTMQRDEEDEEGVFWEKLWNLMIGTPRAGEDWNPMDILVSNSVSGIYGNIPVVEELCDIFFTTVQGYDVERMDASGITRLINSVNTLLKYDPEKSQKTYANTWVDAVSSFAGAGGIPFNTVKRDAVAGIRLLMQWTDNYEAEWELNKLLYNINSTNARSQKNFFDILSKAEEAGDDEAYRYMREDLSNIITSSSKGLTSSYIIKKLKERGNAFDFNSKLWEVELQANFNLPSFNTDMKVERMITSVYVKSKVGEEYDDTILPKTPENSYSIKVKKKNAEGEMVDVSEPVKFKNEADYVKFTEDVGYFSYMTLQCFAGSYSATFSKLTNKQKAYAIKQAYAYAKNKFTKAYDKRHSISPQWHEEDLYDRNAAVSKVAQEILKRAAKQ